MINRTEFAEELILRENIRKAIGIVKTRRKARGAESLVQENELRSVIKGLLKEAQTAVASTAKHASTGINVLEDLLKNSNILFVLESGFSALTTDAQQRQSYRNHILVAVEKALAPEESSKEADENIEKLSEEIDISIDNPEDDPAFIDVEEKEEVDDGEVEKELFALGGEDMTGRNKAWTDFQTISKEILTAYDDLGNPADRSLFGEYLIKNLSLYFDKFESSLQGTVEPPAIAADAEVTEPVVDAGEKQEIANIELQEVIKHLNIEDIIENLL